MAGLTYINQVGAVEGMNQAAPGTLIPDTFVRWSQDVLFDRAGLIRRRGPFKKFDLYKTSATTGNKELFDPTDLAASGEQVLGVLATYDPTGAERIGLLVYKLVNNVAYTVLRVFDSSFVFLGEQVLPFSANTLSIVSAKPALGGGLWVSIADIPSDASTHYQFLWRGGVSSSTQTGYFSGLETPSTGVWDSGHQSVSKNITVSNPTAIISGMFLYVNNYYIGTVKSVNSSTVTLEKYPFIWNSSVNSNVNTSTGNNLGTLALGSAGSPLTLTFYSVRPYKHLHGRGLLSTTNNSQNILSGDVGTSGEGHWSSADIGSYYVYRASDNAFLGKVDAASTLTNKAATMHAAPGITINGDEYIMAPVVSTTFSTDFCVNSSVNTTGTFAGLYTAVYAGYQWYGNFGKDDANINRVVFSAPHDREAVDLSKDSADSIVFPGKSKFRGLGASSAGLLVFLQDRTYILRGNDRTNFSVEQLVPEGCLCPSSIVEYGGGVFWAGKSGIMFYDGASVRNLTKDNLGLYYTDSLDVFNPDQDRAIGFIHKNNLVMHFTSWKSPFDPIRYEPIYAADWLTTDGIKDRAWSDFDPAFDYNDFFTQNNTPIFWDQKILNNPEESASTGTQFSWAYGVYAKDKAGTGTITTFDTTYIFRTDASVSNVNKLQKWNASTSQYVAVNPTTIDSSGSKDYVFRYTSNITSAVAYLWNASTSAWDSTTYSGDFSWGGDSNLDKWGPIRKNTSMTFNIYLPTNALTTFSNLDYRGATSIETVYGLKTILGVNSVEDVDSTSNVSYKLRARLIDIHPVFDTSTNGQDALLVEKINIPNTDLVLGPDFYMQTKHFTLGDPILRKWFQRIMISMLLYDGCMRLDIVDDDDNDAVDINKKKHQFWELFTELGYDWDYLTNIQFPKMVSPNVSSWYNVESSAHRWDEVFTSDFNRYKMRTSWRNSSLGFRLYQLNKYKKPYNGVVTQPTRVEVQAFGVGFKALRPGRV